MADPLFSCWHVGAHLPALSWRGGKTAGLSPQPVPSIGGLGDRSLLVLALALALFALLALALLHPDLSPGMTSGRGLRLVPCLGVGAEPTTRQLAKLAS